MTIQDKLFSGELYEEGKDMETEQKKWNEVLYDYNQTRPSESKKREQLLTKLLASCGEGCYVEPPLHANWGAHTHLGKNVYVNFNLTLVDDAPVYIGDHVKIGPNVTIATAGHPIQPELRKRKMQFNLAVTIKDNVWIGANTVVLPGVTIGKNSVIGAGSVVTKDIPANVVAVGNPCNVLREVNEQDSQYYHKDKKIDPSVFIK